MNPGIYVHLPFCSIHCTYCDFPLTTKLSIARRYYAALLQEIDSHLPDSAADTLYFGGGTPSKTPFDILRQIKERFRLLPGSEITLEANPDDINEAKVREWLEVGINRVSIGIQSLEPSVLRALLRTHTAQKARAAVRTVRSAGCSNLNVDLIIGCPFQSVEGFLNGLQEFIDFSPDHFSLYLLEIHEGTQLNRQLQSGEIKIMEEEAQIDCYTRAVEMLTLAGYDHYEVSNFALPGKRSKHNLKYWTNAEYHAYGAGAASFVKGVRTTNLRSVENYIRSIENKGVPVETRVTEDRETILRNFLIFGLRKTEGVDIRQFEGEFHVSPLSLFGESASTFLENRWLEIVDNRLRLTLAGMLLSNEILSVVV